eukprot:3734595-Prymnesium_polylepis.1
MGGSDPHPRRRSTPAAQRFVAESAMATRPICCLAAGTRSMDVSNASVWLTSSSIISGTACSSAAPLDGRFGTWPVHSQPTSAFCEQP